MSESQGETNTFCATHPTRDPDAENWDERAEELAELIGCDLSLIPRE